MCESRLENVTVKHLDLILGALLVLAACATLIVIGVAAFR
jgi:hypothetical protein